MFKERFWCGIIVSGLLRSGEEGVSQVKTSQDGLGKNRLLLSVLSNHTGGEPETRVCFFQTFLMETRIAKQAPENHDNTTKTSEKAYGGHRTHKRKQIDVNARSSAAKTKKTQRGSVSVGRFS